MRKAVSLSLVCLLLFSVALAAESLQTQDWALVFDSQSYSLGDEAGPVLKTLEGLYGKPVQTQTESCLYTGMDKEFDFGDVVVGTYPIGKGGKDTIETLMVLGGDTPTVREIQIGMSLSQVEAAYGADYTQDYDQLAFCSGDPLKDPVLVFFLDLQTQQVSGYYLMANGG